MQDAMSEMMSEDKYNSSKMKNDGLDDVDPPDNGPWYCSTCVWWGTFYDRFDTPFINLFDFQNFNHGAFFIIINLSIKVWFKDYLHLEPGET